MKKIYTLILSTVALSAAAAQPAAFVERSAEGPVAVLPHRSDARLKAAKAPAEHSWKSLGQAAFTDDILTALFDIRHYTTTLTVEQDELNPGYYRLLDPYGPDSEYGPKLGSFRPDGDDGSGRALVFDATDPDNVILEPSNLGIFNNGEEMFAVSYTYYESTGEMDSSVIDAYGLRGTMKNGIISFKGAQAVFVTTPTLDEAGRGYSANESGELTVKLPGAVDYSLEMLTGSWCADEQGNVVISPWGGDNVAYVKAGVVSGPDDTAGLEKIAASDTRYTSRQGAMLNIGTGHGPNEKVYIAGISFSADGTAQETALHMVYSPDLTDTWRTLPAKARFTEYIVSNIYTDINLGTYDVEVQESAVQPGRYRLVNPYADASYNMWMPSTHGSHSHYLYLDASDAACVVLEESPIGMILNQDGDMRVTSDAQMMLDRGASKQEIAYAKAGGEMKDGVITFPPTCHIYAGFHPEGWDKWYYANYKTDAQGNPVQGDLTIDLSAALAEVDAPELGEEDAPAVYYDLQGRPADASARGTLIRVRPGKADIIRR